MTNKNFNSKGIEYVDFELPSGTLWATKNVGASKATDCGLYFQWGNTQGYSKDQVGTKSGQKRFSWNDYKFKKTSTKYKAYGAALDLEDDAANKNMGGDWHIPTPNQCQELLDNTTNAWTTFDGISGIKFTSKKDSSKYIFIPAAGCAWGSSVRGGGSTGNIWTSMLSDCCIYFGQYVFFNAGGVKIGTSNRNLGLSIRGVMG